MDPKEMKTEKIAHAAAGWRILGTILLIGLLVAFYIAFIQAIQGLADQPLNHWK